MIPPDVAWANEFITEEVIKLARTSRKDFVEWIIAGLYRDAIEEALRGGIACRLLRISVSISAVREDEARE